MRRLSFALAMVAFLALAFFPLPAARPLKTPSAGIGLKRLYGAEPSEWPMFRYGPARTGYNPQETLLRPPLRLKWTYQTGRRRAVSVAVANGLVYFGVESPYNQVYALDARTGAMRWAQDTGGSIYTTPAVLGGMVYVGADDGRLYALDAQTGTLRWSYQTGKAIRSSPTVAGGLVYVGSGHSRVYALDSQTGAPRWSYATTGPVYGPLAVAEGTIYVLGYVAGEYGAGGELYALEAQTGALKWSAGVCGTSGSAAVADGLVHVSSTCYGHSFDWGYVRALDAQTGSLKWSYSPGINMSLSSPAVANGVVYVGATNSKVYALEAAGGGLLWMFATGGYIQSQSSPTVANGVVYVGSDDGKFYGLDADTGAVRWVYSLGLPVRSSPAVAYGMVYVGSDDGNLYAFESENPPTPSIPNLSVIKIASRGEVSPGEALTYLIFLDNSGPAALSLTLTDTIPAGISYITNTVWGGATYSSTINTVLWSGTVPSGASTLPSQVLQFRVTVEPDIATGAITNTAWVSDGSTTTASTARTGVRRLTFLPAMFKEASGW